MPTAGKSFDVQERNSRTLQYAGWTLDPKRPIALIGDATFLETLSGQHAAATAANLLARMTPALRIQIPPVPNRISHMVPGDNLRDALISLAFAVAPGGEYDCRSTGGAFRLGMGRPPADMCVTGNEWSGAFGIAPREFNAASGVVGLGASAAVCGAVAHLFRSQIGPCTVNRYLNLAARSVTVELLAVGAIELPATLGRIWVVGCGSIGSSALFFLGLNPAAADLTLIDGDNVKTHNLDRGACFLADKVGDKKTEACAEMLANCKHLRVTTDPHYLHESALWRARQLGEPDAIISAANEYDVRNMIENSLPPLQIYATTGGSWQLSVWAHVPLKTPCSCCTFPPASVQAQTACARAGILVSDAMGVGNDASLPFLSFLGGVLTVAELYRAATRDLVGRCDVWTRRDLDFLPLTTSVRGDCTCRNRNAQTYRRVLADSRYAALSL